MRHPIIFGIMQIAGSVDLQGVLEHLALSRPVFHSEADFQLALAWQVQTEAPHLRVRLETRPTPHVHLDLAFEDPSTKRATAVEVKYLTRLWEGTVGGERFALKNHGAQDIRAYDVVKDISRVEKFIADRPRVNGAVVVLSNDPSYWRAPKLNDTSNASAFRLCQGRLLAGVCSWGPNTGAGTRKGREEDLPLSGRYGLSWTTYSKMPGGGTGSEFRQLIVPIGESADAEAPVPNPRQFP